MKKCVRFLTTWVLLLTMALSFVPVSASDDRVEISFCVGDDVLSINGEQVQVERPYVVGEGVTLVPLRVITEAFGATVEWIDETQTINLSYPDVEIVLQIGNPIAEVNQKAEALLSAPELTGGFTMVPLRFISETFGADVSYDETTERITVVKESGTVAQGIVQGAIDAAMIGDSYYKWSMDNPVDMQMVDRSFDGTDTIFEYDEDNFVSLSIGPVEEDYDFERDFVNTKDGFKGYTLAKADKDTSDPSKRTMHFQAWDKNVFWNIRQFVTDKYTFILLGRFETEETELRDEGVRIMDTFDCVFTKEGTYDLSNVREKTRTYESEKLGFSIKIPHDFYQSGSEDLENELTFYRMDVNDTVSRIHIGIYSKSSEGTAKGMAEKDYTNNKQAYNPEIATFSEGITERTYANNNIMAFEYTVDKAATDGMEHMRDVFFELGDYVYNVSVSLKPLGTYVSEIDDIINSIRAKKIDSAKVGILMRNVSDDEGTFTVKGDGWSLAVPNTYAEVEASDSAVILQDRRTGIILSLAISAADGATFWHVNQNLKDMQSEAEYTEDVEVIHKVVNTTFGKLRYADMTLSIKEDKTKVFFRQLGTYKDDMVIVFAITYPELVHSEHNIQETEKIVTSLTFED